MLDRFRFAVQTTIFACFLVSKVLGGCSEAESDATAFDESRSVAEVKVLAAEPYLAADGAIRTKFSLELVENFKGVAPDHFEISTAGGEMGGRMDFRSDTLPLKAGKSYILHLSQDAAGAWLARPFRAYRAAANDRDSRAYFRKQERGTRPKLIPISAPETGTSQGNANGVPGSVVTSTGYSETGGQPTRFTTCDGGDAIPYLIDIDPAKLPTGMTQAGAVAAVAEALQAWAGASSLRFRCEGTVAFGMAASSVNVSDKRLRIQLHDNYNAITTSGVLGIGGGSFQTASANFTGGRVVAQGFQDRLYGYVVLESTASFMLNTTNFKRVLTHEIGHSLGLAHSSENSSEPNAILKAATMYYNAPSGSTGATIQTYDVDRIQYGYPVSNTPPFATDRLLLCITSPSPASLPAVPGVNRIRIRGLDRQDTALTLTMASSSANNGTFSLSGDILTYAPNGNFSDTRLSDTQIEAGTYYDTASIYLNDGVNLSRAITCVVPGFARDTTPSDGLPDAWMTANFGSTAVGAVGSNQHPDSDPDKDGLCNRIECYLGTNPNSAASGPVKPTYDPITRRLSWTPARFAPYAVESSSTLTANSWSLRRMGTLYQSSGTLTFDFVGNALPAKEFYRVATGP